MNETKTSELRRAAGPVTWPDEPFRLLVETVTDYAIFLLDPEGRVSTWNAGAQRIKGYAADDIIGRHFSVFYPGEAIERGWPEHELEMAARNGRFEDEGWRLRKDGSRFWANVIITALRNADGALVGFAKITRDLTERRQNEERMRQSEERFRLLVEGVQDYAIFLLDTEGRVATWNAGAQRIDGYRAEEIIGRHFSVFYPPEAVERGWPERELSEAARLGRFEDEGWRVRKDGSRFWANVIVTPLRDHDGNLRGFSKITRDLTERREQEERLRQSEEGFRLLLEGVQDYAIFMLDPEGRVNSWNAGAQRINGWRADEIVGQSFERFFLPEDVEAGLPRQELRQALLNRRAEVHGWRVRKDGSRYWAEVVLTPLHDEEGKLRGFAKVTRDLSERKRMETLEEQGRHLTEFLAMLAHELRNPLAPIRNALGIMAVSAPGSPQVNWSREVIERQAEHLTRLVDDLLDVSRITRGKLRLQATPMDVRDAVERAIEGARPLVESRRHRLHVELGREALMLNGDMTRITQSVLNLLNNAAKYTPPGGDIRVRARADEGDIVLTVRDTGVGIPSHLIDHVFELFAQGERTLDRAEGGLGIGLTLARRIVELHGGRISVRSEGPNEGSEFTVRLPRLAESLAEARPRVPEFALPRGGPRRSVLVVDDNRDGASSVALLLRMAGHDVSIAHDGADALAQCERGLPQIVFLDIGLPGMDGYEVAHHLRACSGAANTKIFAMTGYGQEEDIQRSHASGFDGHLVKPVLPEELFRLVAQG